MTSFPLILFHVFFGTDWRYILIRLGLPTPMLQPGSYQQNYQQQSYPPTTVSDSGILSKLKGILGPGGQPQQQQGGLVPAGGVVGQYLPNTGIQQQGSSLPVLSLV